MLFTKKIMTEDAYGSTKDLLILVCIHQTTKKIVEFRILRITPLQLKSKLMRNSGCERGFTLALSSRKQSYREPRLNA
jgi:hypothetical protein